MNTADCLTPFCKGAETKPNISVYEIKLLPCETSEVAMKGVDLFSPTLST